MNTPDYTIPPRIRQRREAIDEIIKKRNEKVGAIVFSSKRLPIKK
jgi:hypothetical protein